MHREVFFLFNCWLGVRDVCLCGRVIGLVYALHRIASIHYRSSTPLFLGVFYALESTWRESITACYPRRVPMNPSAALSQIGIN